MLRANLDGRVAIVTGAGRNIGRAIAIRLADSGATVACLYGSDSAAAQETCSLIATRCNVIAEAFQLDLQRSEQISTTVQHIIARFGSADILVNNAAIRPRVPIADVTSTDWDRVLSTNLKAPFFLCQAVIPTMKSNAWGRIVNVSGLDANWGNPQRPHVVASKLGLIGLTRAIANETARWGITANALIPGTIDTDRPVPQ